MDATARRLRAQIAANARWSRHDPKAELPKVRAASPGAVEYWEKRLDPEGVLDPAERRRRAVNARQAYMQQLALKRLRKAEQERTR